MTDWLGIALGLIILFFAVFLGVKRIFPRVSCAICAAVSATWIVLISAGIFYDQSVRGIIAILVAQSAVGLMYAFQGKINRSLLVFRLGYLCSAITLAAWIAGERIGILALGTLASLWAVSGFLFAFRNSPMFRSAVEKVIACCKDW